MSAYLIGNLLGRLVMSLILVWLGLWIWHGFKASKANQRILKPLPLLITLLLFALGLVGILGVRS